MAWECALTAESRAIITSRMASIIPSASLGVALACRPAPPGRRARRRWCRSCPTGCVRLAGRPAHFDDLAAAPAEEVDEPGLGIGVLAGEADSAELARRGPEPASKARVVWV